MTVRRTLARWTDRLAAELDSVPSLGAGEVGLDAKRKMRRAVTAALDSVMDEARLRVETETFRRLNAEERQRAVEEGAALRWHCAADPCERCAPLCGSAFGPEASVPDVPVHPRCRCILLVEAGE